MAARVARPRASGKWARFEGQNIRTNAEADGELLDSIATPDAAGAKLLSDAASTMRLTARGYHRVLRVSRTVPISQASPALQRGHIAEALSPHRRLPRTI